MHIEVQGMAWALGRLLLGGAFVFAGVRHFFLLAELTKIIAVRGIPAARVVLVTGSLFQIVAGALLMLGLLVAPAALGLLAFTIAASTMMLNFWSMEGPERVGAQNAWLSNIAVMGGLLIAAAQEF